MNELINNICKVEYTSISEVNSISFELEASVIIDATWYIMDCVPGATLLISDSNPASGREYNTNFRCTLKTKLQSKDLHIVKVTLDDESTLIIGDLDLPVSFDEDHSLTSKSLSFDHKSWHYPYPLAVSSGSGSSQGGL